MIVAAMEKRLNCLEGKVSAFRELQDHVGNVQESFHDLRERIAFVEENIKNYSKDFKENVENSINPLEKEFQKLQSSLNKAHLEIEAHGEVLVSLLSGEKSEEEESESDNVDLDEDAWAQLIDKCFCAA